MSTDHEAPSRDGQIAATKVEEAPAGQAPARPARQKSKAPTEPVPDRTSLHMEAERLREFKKRKLKSSNQTPCPACATPVHIDANLCPHCSSDIAANNALVRESIRRLDEINSQLDTAEKSVWINHLARLTRPIWQKVRSLLADPRVQDDLRVPVLSLFIFFALILALRALGNAPLFWSVAIIGGFVVYSLLGRRSEIRRVTVDLYRTILVVGLILVMTITLTQPFSAGTGGSVVVQPRVVNIRQAATTDSRIVTQANQGDRLSVLERDGSWYLIKTRDGKTGWVSANLVTD